MPDYPLFHDSPDYPVTRHRSEIREFGNIRQEECPNCHLAYNGSWLDHRDRCSAVGIRRIKEVPLFVDPETKTQTVEQEVIELRKELAELKKQRE
jgi:hypothetical protein